MRKFNREGPVFADRHYCIPPLSRVNLDEILELIADTKYFVLHAPRQTGKTSTLLALQDRLNAEGQYRCLYVNVEAGQSAKEDTAQAMQVLLGQLATRSRVILQDDFVHRVARDMHGRGGPSRCARRGARALVRRESEAASAAGGCMSDYFDRNVPHSAVAK